MCKVVIAILLGLVITGTAQAEDSVVIMAQDNLEIVLAKYDRPDDFLYEEKIKDLPVVQEEEMEYQQYNYPDYNAEEEVVQDNTYNEHQLYND